MDVSSRKEDAAYKPHLIGPDTKIFVDGEEHKLVQCASETGGFVDECREVDGKIAINGNEVASFRKFGKVEISIPPIFRGCPRWLTCLALKARYILSRKKSPYASDC